MRILLVEDDEDLGEAVKQGLQQESYSVDWVKDGWTADQALKTESFDSVILDLGIPKMNGLEVLRNLRKRSQDTPVLILTARDSVEDRVKGLDSGADDYINKPFKIAELYARLRAIQRRQHARATPEIVFGALIIDPVAHQVTFNGEVVQLPRREFALLQKLIENHGRALSREQLNQSIYSWDEDVDSNALEVHIHNLRKKFGAHLIRTIRGVGYMVEKTE